MRRKGLVTLGLAIGLFLAGSFSSFAGKLVVENSKYRYLKDDGNYATNEWIESEGSWSYYDGNGYGLKDTWLDYNNQLYYINNIGDLGCDGLIVKDKDGKYEEILWGEQLWGEEDDVRKWKERDAFVGPAYEKAVAIYGVRKDGSMVKNGWHHYQDRYWFYFGEDGNMLINTITPDGYTVDELGRWVVNGVVQK